MTDNHTSNPKKLMINQGINISNSIFVFIEFHDSKSFSMFVCSSSESSSKDTVQSVENVAENELKSAAACFSLISLG